MAASVSGGLLIEIHQTVQVTLALILFAVRFLLRRSLPLPNDDAPSVLYLSVSLCSRPCSDPAALWGDFMFDTSTYG